MLRCSVTTGLGCLLFVGGCASSDKPSQENAQLCSAFKALAQDVKDTGRSQSVTVFKERPMEVACETEENDAAQSSYCAGVLESISMEFTHAYPWELQRCILSIGVSPKIETADEYTGLVDRDKLIQLEVVIFGEVKVRLAWESSVQEQRINRFDQYWGRYELVLSKM